MKDKANYIIDLLAKLGNYKDVKYVIDEECIKDGKPIKIKNVRIKEIIINDLPGDLAE